MPLLTAGVVLGIGLGGFIDGIVLHHILQWHNMGSAIVPPHSMGAMRLNMWWDGLFHLASWLITLIGVCMLWSTARAGRLRGTAGMFTGELLFGWGVFNVFEGIVDHHLLALHHVRDLPDHVPAYDWVFLGISLGLVLTGWMLMRPGSRSRDGEPRT